MLSFATTVLPFSTVSVTFAAPLRTNGYSKVVCHVSLTIRPRMLAEAPRRARLSRPHVISASDEHATVPVRRRPEHH